MPASPPLWIEPDPRRRQEATAVGPPSWIRARLRNVHTTDGEALGYSVLPAALLMAQLTAASLCGEKPLTQLTPWLWAIVLQLPAGACLPLVARMLGARPRQREIAGLYARGVGAIFWMPLAGLGLVVMTCFIAYLLHVTITPLF